MLVGLLKSHEEKVQVQACLSLRNLSADSTLEDKVRFSYVFPIKRVNDTYILTIVISLFCSFVSCLSLLQIVAEAALAPLVGLLRSPNAALGEHSSATIANLCANPAIRLRVVQEGALPALVSLLG